MGMSAASRCDRGMIMSTGMAMSHFQVLTAGPTWRPLTAGATWRPKTGTAPLHSHSMTWQECTVDTFRSNQWLLTVSASIASSTQRPSVGVDGTLPATTSIPQHAHTRRPHLQRMPEAHASCRTSTEIYIEHSPREKRDRLQSHDHKASRHAQLLHWLLHYFIASNAFPQTHACCCYGRRNATGMSADPSSDWTLPAGAAALHQHHKITLSRRPPFADRQQPRRRLPI